MTDLFGSMGKGPRWEFRTHRAAFASGWYVRRNVNLRERVRGTPQTMAEVDILGLDYDAALTARVLVGECKDRKGSAKEADRVVWLLGLSRLLGAQHIVLAKPSISEATRTWSKPAGVTLWDEATILAIERAADLGSDADYVGSFRPAAHPRLEGLKAVSPGSAALRRAWDYVTGAFWYTRDPSRPRRLHAYFALLNDEKGVLAREAADSLVAEGLLALAACTLSVSGQLRGDSPARGRGSLIDDLSSGVAPAQELREIAARADDYYRDALGRVLKSTGRGDARLEIPRLSEQIARPPEWVDDFVDLAQKLGATPWMATHLLRFADLLLIEHLIAGKALGGAILLTVPEPHAELLRLLQLVGLFVQRVWGFDLEFISRLLALGTVPLGNVAGDSLGRQSNVAPGERNAPQSGGTRGEVASQLCLK